MEICKSCPAISEDDLQAAIGELGTYVDVTAEDLLRIYVLAVRHARKRHSTIVPVSTIMTRKVIAVAADRTIRDSAALMSAHRIKGMPVVDEQNRVIGVVSEVDRSQAAGVHGTRGFLGGLFGKSAKPQSDETRVRNIMKQPAITIEPDADIQEVAAVLDLHHIRRLPVVDDEGRLVGIVSRGDVIRSLAKKP